MSSYSDAVVALGPVAYWRMGDSSGSLAEENGGTPIAVAGVAYDQPGPLASGDEGAVGFDGVDDYGQVALDLSHTDALTLAWWMRWDTFADNDDLALEFSPNFNASNGGFLVDPNAAGGSFEIAIRGVGGVYNNALFDRPGAGGWHLYAVVIDRAAVAADEITPHLDGVEVEFTKTLSDNVGGNFASSTLYLMSRAASALFGEGAMAHLAIFDRALASGDIAGLWDARDGAEPFELTLDPAGETGEAQPLALVKTVGPDPAAGETGQAVAVNLTQPATVLLAPVGESDAARPLTIVKQTAVGPAFDTSTAGQLHPTITYSLGPAAEAGAAMRVHVARTATLGAALDSGEAQGLVFIKHVRASPASEHDAAAPFGLGDGGQGPVRLVVSDRPRTRLVVTDHSRTALALSDRPATRLTVEDRPLQ